MTLDSFGSVQNWTLWLVLAAHLAAGGVLGVVYFRALWWNVRLFAQGGRVTTAIALAMGRFVLLGGLLGLASLEGALPLLAMALGVLIARSAVLRRFREASQ